MIKGLLNRLVSGPAFPAIAPDAPFVAVGDIHGRMDLLQRLLDQNPNLPLVCVGDYVDRGDESADVLRCLYSMPEITCLSGNHEEMMLNFLESPEHTGSRWLRYGGLQTLASFGVAGVTDSSGPDALVGARDRLAEAMGPDLITWMQTLPTRWQSGNVAVVHAAADPARTIDAQNDSALHWGHPDFTKTMRRDGVWVVHGHTIVPEPETKRGRIAIDTGAYATGRLTAAWIEADKVTFETIT